MSRRLRIIDFDLECLPGHWIGGDYVSKILTAAAWKEIGSVKDPDVLTHYDMDSSAMASTIAAVLENADIVVGHYIRGFDLPLLNGSLLRGGFRPLGRMMTHDTKLDLRKAHGRSQSQENLAAQLGIGEEKVKVTLPEWEAFNTRQPGAREKGIERVRQDVIQNIELREALLEAGWLGGPTAWDPGSKKSGSYRP